MNLKDTYNRIAKDWQRDHKQDTWWIDGVDKFISFLKPNGAVLDVGCGAGEKSKYLINKGLNVTGIDFSEKMIEIARREVPGGRFFVADIKDTKTVTGMFDGIFMQAVLLHIPKNEVMAVLEKLNRKLKSSGCIYIAVKEKRLGGFEEEVKKEDDCGYPYERFFSYFGIDEIKEYLKRLGMRVVYENIASSGGRRWIQVIGQK